MMNWIDKLHRFEKTISDRWEWWIWLPDTIIFAIGIIFASVVVAIINLLIY